MNFCSSCCNWTRTIFIQIIIQFLKDARVLPKQQDSGRETWRFHSYASSGDDVSEERVTDSTDSSNDDILEGMELWTAGQSAFVVEAFSRQNKLAVIHKMTSRSHTRNLMQTPKIKWHILLCILTNKVSKWNKEWFYYTNLEIVRLPCRTLYK
jgi:hypothetical protein